MEAYKEMQARRKLKELFNKVSKSVTRILVDVHEDGEHVSVVEIDRDGVIYFDKDDYYKGHIDMFPDATYSLIKEVDDELRVC